MSRLLNINWQTLPNAPAPGSRVCALSDLPDGLPVSIRMEAETPEQAGFELLLFRRGTSVNAYVNQCPHQWLPMQRRDGKFLMWSEVELMCAHHSAVYNLEEGGRCIMGPCQGSNLICVPVSIKDSDVLLTDHC